MKEYIPRPADTNGVKLPEDLIPLIEDFAIRLQQAFCNFAVVKKTERI